MKYSTYSFFRSSFLFASVLFFYNSTVLHALDKPWIEQKDSDFSFPEINLPSFAPVIERLGKSVVNIQTEGKDESGNPAAGIDPANPFDFLLQGPNRKRKFTSLGSGFVIHPDGYIVTNHHVVEGASKIMVSFKDEKKPKTATVVGSDPKTDLALLKLEEKGAFDAAPLGDSETIRPGDWVIAIGNPFRLGHTATLGIVSAVSRKLPGGKPYDDFIQTDASINPGNSGGPLFNSRGEVVGVSTAIYSRGGLLGGGGSIGIGFAIPVNLVKSIITQIKDKGKVTRGWLGVLIQPVSEDIASAMNLPKAEGSLVAEVVKGSPADKAGFKRGDVIVKYNELDVVENSELPLLVADTAIGKKVPVSLIRSGKVKKIYVTIEELKEEDAVEVVDDAPGVDRFGLATQDLSPEIARTLGFSGSSGALVSDVEQDSAAAEAGLQRGDLIIEVNSQIVQSSRDFRTLTKSAKAGIPLLLLVRRGEGTIFLTLKPSE
jgi:serine protease Do